MDANTIVLLGTMPILALCALYGLTLIFTNWYTIKKHEKNKP